jgi:hypothetical protein
MVRRGKELGLRVLLADVLPWNNGWPDAELKISRLNELVRKVAAEEDVLLLHFHDTLEDPDRPGRMRAEWTADGDHPSVEGYQRLGELVGLHVVDVAVGGALDPVRQRQLVRPVDDHQPPRA